MKLANDALLAIIGVFRKGLSEGIDISGLLRDIDLEEDTNGKLALSVEQKDIWSKD